MNKFHIHRAYNSHMLLIFLVVVPFVPVDFAGSLNRPFGWKKSESDTQRSVSWIVAGMQLGWCFFRMLINTTRQFCQPADVLTVPVDFYRTTNGTFFCDFLPTFVGIDPTDKLWWGGVPPHIFAKGVGCCVDLRE